MPSRSRRAGQSRGAYRCSGIARPPPADCFRFRSQRPLEPEAGLEPPSHWLARRGRTDGGRQGPRRARVSLLTSTDGISPGLPPNTVTFIKL